MVEYDRNCQIYVNPTNPFPSAILTGTTYKSGIMPLQVFNQWASNLVGYNAISASVKADQVVTITVQRYMDAAGLVPVGSNATATTVANTASAVSLTTVAPAMFYDVQISNSSGSTANIAAGTAAIIIMPNP
jgi:hypothetical protein